MCGAEYPGTADTGRGTAATDHVRAHCALARVARRGCAGDGTRAASSSGAHEISIREYKLLLTYPETNPRTAYLALAKAYLGLGDKKEAASFARKVLGIDGDNAEAEKILEQSVK